MSPLMILLLVLLAVAVLGGGFGYQRYGPWGGGFPVGLVLIVLLVLYLTGHLHG